LREEFEEPLRHRRAAEGLDALVDRDVHRELPLNVPLSRKTGWAGFVPQLLRLLNQKRPDAVLRDL
jgi:hypothetical protein